MYVVFMKIINRMFTQHRDFRRNFFFILLFDYIIQLINLSNYDLHLGY